MNDNNEAVSSSDVAAFLFRECMNVIMAIFKLQVLFSTR